MSKAILERLEQPDLSGYVTDVQIINLTNQINALQAEVNTLKSKVDGFDNLSASNLIKIHKFDVIDRTPGIADSYNLAELLDIIDPEQWNFKLFAFIKNHSGRMFYQNWTLSPVWIDITTSVINHTGTVSINYNYEHKWLRRLSFVSYSAIIIATRK